MSKSDWLGIAVAALTVGVSFLVGGPVWGLGFLVVGVIALLVWHFHREEDQSVWKRGDATDKALQLQRVADALSEKRVEGQQIFGWPFFDDDDARAFRDAMNKWADELDALMKRVGCTTSERNEVIRPPYSEFTASRPFDEYQKLTWNEFKRRMQMHIDKLGTAIRRYEDAAREARR